MLLQEKWKAAETALSDGKQEPSLKIIAEILVAIDATYGDKDALEEVHKTYILTMARYHRIEKMYDSGTLGTAEYLPEMVKLDKTIQSILKELRAILEEAETVINNTSQQVEFEIPSDYEGDEQDVLSMIYEIADKLGIPREDVVPRNFDN